MEDAREMKSMLVAYTESTANLLSEPRPLFLSLATDKSTVKTFSLQNTAAVLPSNKACWLVPQVSPQKHPLIQPLDCKKRKAWILY